MVFSWTQWFGELIKHLQHSRNARYSGPIEVTRSHKQSWTIQQKELPSIGELEVYLSMNYDAAIFEHAVTSPLQTQLAAKAVIENQIEQDRLVRNYFFTCTGPEKLGGGSNVWLARTDDGKMEYILGHVLAFPLEDLVIDLTIVTPDPLLEKLTPRIKIVPIYDSAAIPWAGVVRFLSIILLSLSLIATFCLAVLAWETQKK